MSLGEIPTNKLSDLETYLETREGKPTQTLRYSLLHGKIIDEYSSMSRKIYKVFWRNFHAVMLGWSAFCDSFDKSAWTLFDKFTPEPIVSISVPLHQFSGDEASIGESLDQKYRGFLKPLASSISEFSKNNMCEITSMMFANDWGCCRHFILRPLITTDNRSFETILEIFTLAFSETQ